MPDFADCSISPVPRERMNSSNHPMTKVTNQTKNKGLGNGTLELFNPDQMQEREQVFQTSETSGRMECYSSKLP